MQIPLPEQERPTAGGLGYLQLKARREAAEALAAKRKSRVQENAFEALSTGRMDAIQSKKQFARTKIEAIREKIKVLKQLYGANPKGMAKALAQVFKELKSAVRDFRDATNQQMEVSGEGVRAAMANDEEQEAGKAEKEAAAAPSSGAGETAGTSGEKGADASADPGLAKGLYEDTVKATRELVGQEGLEFLKEVKSVLKKLLEMLEAARTQARARKQDDETDKAFEDAGTALKELKDEMDAMTEDIRDAAPTAGMRLSVAA